MGPMSFASVLPPIKRPTNDLATMDLVDTMIRLPMKCVVANESVRDN